jgi:hypothetical protein
MPMLKQHLVRGTVVGVVALATCGAALAQSPAPARPAMPALAAPPTPPVLPVLPMLPAPPWPLADGDFDVDVNLDIAPALPFDLDLTGLSERVREISRGLQAQPRTRTAPQPAPAPQPPQPRLGPGPGQPVSPAESLYEQALNYIDRAQYERALERIELLIQRYDQGGAAAITNKVDGAFYWKAYTQIKQKQVADALTTLETMQKKFGDSRWMKDAKALEVEARQAAGQAVSPDAQGDEELKLLALRGIMQSDPERGVPMIEQVLAGTSSVKVKENALFVLSQSRSARAREIISSIARGGANPDLQLRAVRYLGAIGGPENRQLLQDVYRSTSDVSIKRAVIRSFVPSGDRDRVFAIAKSETNADLRGEAIRQLGAMHATAELSEFYATESSVELKKGIIQALFASGASDKLIDLAKNEKDDQLRRTAIRNLGVMSVIRSGDALKGLYGSESNRDVKAEIVNALFVQRNAATLVDLARAEKDQDMKREIVTKLSVMRDKIATDYLLELLK